MTQNADDDRISFKNTAMTQNADDDRISFKNTAMTQNADDDRISFKNTAMTQNADHDRISFKNTAMTQNADHDRISFKNTAMTQNADDDRSSINEPHWSGNSSGKQNTCAQPDRKSRDGGGIERSGGLLYLELEQRFEGHSTSSISWIFSLNTALRQSLGPVVGILCNRFSCRSVVIAGGIITCAGLVLSAFPPVLLYMYFSYGILTDPYDTSYTSLCIYCLVTVTGAMEPVVWNPGIGVALAYAPSVVIVGFYFTKYRGKAVGMSVSGVGMGSLVIPPITEALLSCYGYFGALLVMGGIGLNLTVGGALFRSVAETWKYQQAEVSSESLHELQNFQQMEKSKEENESLVENHMGSEMREKNDIVVTNKIRLMTKSSRGPTTSSCWQTFLKKYLDVSLLLDLPFLSFCVGMFLFSLAFQASLVFLPALAKERGVSKELTPILLSVIGATEALSRILAGVLFDRPRIQPVRLYIYNFDVALVAVVTFLCTVVRTFPAFLAIGACYGLVVGMYISQKSVVIVDLVGEEVLNSSFGLLIWFQGMGSLIGPPIAGALKDAYQRYDESFYFGGGVTLAGATIMATGNAIFLMKKKKKNKSNSTLAANDI